MSDADDVLLDLKADFVAEALDLAYTHAAWGSRHFQGASYERGLDAFDKLVNAVRAAAPEAKAIRIALDAKKANGAAAAEWRRDRDRTRPTSRGAGNFRTLPADKPAQPARVCQNGEPSHEKGRRIGDSTDAREQVAGSATSFNGAAA